jgi:ornithine cyclodeaminase/alanine dehydrogenase-like protein (mu-crystallin family)
MLILGADEVRRALPMRETIEVMKRAYAAYSAGRAEVPLRTQLVIAPHQATSLFMPAYVRTEKEEALAVKVVSLFPGNPARALEFIQAVVLLLESDTGRPVALLEGRTLTSIRTGAASAAAADLLAWPNSRVAAVFGAGVQGRAQLEAVCTVRKIETAWIYDSDPKKARQFVDDLAGHGSIPKDIRIAANPAQAVKHAEIICTATTSKSPVFSDSDLKPGAHISAIGSYLPEMQEVPPETIQRAMVVVDSRTAALAETGDLILPIRQGMFTEKHIHAELGEIVLGTKPGRQYADEITYFKSVGVAVQDAMAAQFAWQNAQKMGIGQIIKF